MPRTTDRSATVTPAPTSAASTGPLVELELEYERRSLQGPEASRCLNHPYELALGGIPVICRVCRARRDWLLISEGRHVYIRCRCSNQWLEPEITRADFDAMLNNPQWTHYRTAQQANAALGYDGSLAGSYLL